ncbi:MAG: hypothetical protein AAGG75_06010 [Bacteroidota bacterium]
MKVLSLYVVMTLMAVLPGYANTGVVGPYDPPMEGIGDGTVSLSAIFFEDIEGELLFIDFEAIGDGIVQLNILKGQGLMLQDDVTDLPANTIYELNLEVFRSGTYTIELVTDKDIKIHKEITIE